MITRAAFTTGLNRILLVAAVIGWCRDGIPGRYPRQGLRAAAGARLTGLITQRSNNQVPNEPWRHPSADDSQPRIIRTRR
jgi:hypothetical protein